MSHKETIVACNKESTVIHTCVRMYFVPVRFEYNLTPEGRLPTAYIPLTHVQCANYVQVKVMMCTCYKYHYTSDALHGCLLRVLLILANLL